MGYSKTLAYGDSFALGTDNGMGSWSIKNLTITTVNQNLTLGSITLPTDMPPRRVYVDLSIGAFRDTSGALNFMNLTDVIAEKGAASKLCVSLSGSWGYTLANETRSGIYVWGTTNARDAFKEGELTDIKMNVANCNANNLILEDVQCIVRVVV